MSKISQTLEIEVHFWKAMSDHFKSSLRFQKCVLWQMLDTNHLHISLKIELSLAPQIRLNSSKLLYKAFICEVHVQRGSDVTLRKW